jgi:hypothetical protein
MEADSHVAIVRCRILMLPVIIAAAVMAGCARAALTRADVDGRIVCNTDRMDQVERAARRENKEVHWLQCPQAVLRTM